MPRIEPLVGEQVQEWRESIGDQTKKGWQRAQATRLPPPQPAGEGLTVAGNTATFQHPDFRQRSPQEVYEMSRRHIMSQMRRSRDDFQLMVRQLRNATSLIDHLTDEQALELLEQEWDKKLRRSLAKVYPKLGRGKELTVKTGGY